MVLDFFQLLGQSYGILQFKRNQPQAVALLRQAFAAEPELRAEAEAHRDRLDAVIKARGANACHVTDTSHALLAAALDKMKGPPE